MASSSVVLRSAGRALRRSIPRRSYAPLPAREDSRLFSTTDFAGRRQSGYKKALPMFARSLAENPRRLFSSDCSGRTDPNEKLHSMDDLLECKRQMEKNKEVGASRDADISEHEELHKKMESSLDKLCRCLDEQEHLLDEIEVQMENNKKFDQVKRFLVAIPTFVCIGLILDRMHMFG